MNKEDIQRSFYFPLCSKEQVDRIFDVKTSDDYLLKVRADTALDHMRIYRVIRNRMHHVGDKWDFEKYFNDAPFREYINSLNTNDAEEANTISKGFVFCNSPNGRIVKTDYGNVITISESLRYFLYYMNLVFLNFDNDTISPSIRWSALHIAIRTMLQSEALDFDIDPRGEVPKDIDQILKFHTDRQLEFVIGHEYAHHFLGHLNDNNLVEGQFLSAIDSDSIKHKFFSYAQQEELDADLDAIERPEYSEESKLDMVHRALIFFVYLDVYHKAKSQIMPSFGVSSHPEPMDRFNNIYSYYKDKLALDKENLDALVNVVDILKDKLTEDIAVNFESYEQYGSVYLAEWRGKVLVDRVDF
ncbi:hypothetical protein BK412_26120 [Vibrio campbellii]|uniref:M48 family metalloprotease n=1 Tax=Vibrio campbellii TaxID=680 RepID=UPI0009BE7DB8|nr:M48 family metalloprotease [Vibrio campbellii]OQP99792.1 hypothetical protein BK412_26120 [Vibrio campbellii]